VYQAVTERRLLACLLAGQMRLRTFAAEAPGPYFIIVMKEREVRGDAVLLSSNALYSHGGTTALLPPKTSWKSSAQLTLNDLSCVSLAIKLQFNFRLNK